MAPLDLEAMIAAVVEALLPGAQWRALPASHPYTEDGREVEVLADGEWVELLECGLAHPRVLAAGGLGGHSGLAMGIGLDRAVMLRKGIADIRLLRSDDPRVAAQMRDLEAYREVSAQPPARRDMSIACAPGLTDEDLGDRVRGALAPSRPSGSRRSPSPRARRRASCRPRPASASASPTTRRTCSCAWSCATRRARWPRPRPTRCATAIYAALHEGSEWEWAAAPA